MTLADEDSNSIPTDDVNLQGIFCLLVPPEKLKYGKRRLGESTLM